MFNNIRFAWNVSLETRNFTKMNDGLLTGKEVMAMQLCHGFLGAIGLHEYLGVILVILFHKSKILLGFPSNWCVLSLAAIDALTCILINLVNTYYIAGQRIPILLTMSRFVAHYGITSLLLLTFNRFLCICLQFFKISRHHDSK